MWASFMAYTDDCNMNKMQPKQLFITKNPVLRDEVEKSFWNMGLAFKKRKEKRNKTNYDTKVDDGRDQLVEKNPLFLTENEWMNILG